MLESESYPQFPPVYFVHRRRHVKKLSNCRRVSREQLRLYGLNVPENRVLRYWLYELARLTQLAEHEQRWRKWHVLNTQPFHYFELGSAPVRHLLRQIQTESLTCPPAGESRLPLRGWRHRRRIRVGLPCRRHRCSGYCRPYPRPVGLQNGDRVHCPPVYPGQRPYGGDRPLPPCW